MHLPLLRRLALVIASASLLAACQFEANTPMRAFDVKNTAQTGTLAPINVTLTASFASKAWCQDEGAMAISALGSGDVPIRPVSCTKRQTAGGESEGVFQITTSLVKTAGAANPQTVVEEVLNDDLARFAVFPHGKRKGLLSVGLFLNLAKIEAAKAELLKMPVFQEGGDTGTMQVTFSITVTNDLPNMAKFYLSNVAADADPSYTDSVLQLPPGGSETITLDPASQAQLMQQGWVNFFAMDAN
ncbi:MAG: hypothetical protein JNJ53_12615 [Rhizobiales bacterium]|nr:hypothetical protein [Hyphomicrobiales bacterium]